MMMIKNAEKVSLSLLKALKTLALINSTKNLDELINEILESVKKVMGVEASSLIQVDEQTDELFFSKVSGGSQLVKDIRLKMGVGIAGRVAETKKPMIINDVQKSKYHYKEADDLTHFVTKRIICVPLIIREKIIGVLECLNKKNNEEFDEDDLIVFSAFAAQVAVALENARLYRLTMYDSLTGVFNRRYFDIWINKEYERVKRFNTNLSLIMIDIDHFKRINDSKGHQAGDSILFNLAQRIQKVTRKADLFARYGGEEFVLVLSETGPEQAKQVAEKCRKIVDDTKFEYNKKMIHTTISLGVVSYNGDSELSLSQFIRGADHALYLAKENGRNTVFFTENNSD